MCWRIRCSLEEDILRCVDLEMGKFGTNCSLEIISTLYCKRLVLNANTVQFRDLRQCNRMTDYRLTDADSRHSFHLGRNSQLYYTCYIVYCNVLYSISFYVQCLFLYKLRGLNGGTQFLFILHWSLIFLHSKSIHLLW